jgi:phospholipid/cholesterol/gamma-HCH transport system substrate-binding protein
MKPLSINKKREIRIGLMAIIAIGLLFFGINYLKGVNIFSPSNYYIAVYKNVDGLVPANAVTIKGYKIGQVHKIKYDFSHDSAFQVYLSINKDIKLPKGTYAELKDAGLMGGKSIELVFPESSQSYYKSGDIIPSYIEEGFMATLNKKVMPKIEALLPKVDSLVDALHAVASNPSIGKSLASIERTTNNLDQTSNQLKLLMSRDVPTILTKINVMADNFDAVSNNLHNIDFAATIASVNKTLANVQSITEKVNSPTGTLGMLLNDTTLYVSLSHLTQNTNALMVDLKAHPKRYVHFSLIDFK